MSKRLIDWLLEVDLFDLAEAFKRAPDDDGAQHSILDALDDAAAPVEQELPDSAPSVADTQGAKKKSRLGIAVAVVAAIVALAFVLLAPDAALGPMAGPLDGIRAPIQKALGNAPPPPPAEPAPPAPVPATAPVAATDVTAAAAATAPGDLTAPAGLTAATATTAATGTTPEAARKSGAPDAGPTRGNTAGQAPPRHRPGPRPCGS